MLGGAGSPGGDELLTVTVVRDDHGYGMKVSGDNPVYVQSVKEHGAAWRAGLRSGDRILRVDNLPVTHHSHQQVVQMIRANPTTVLTVHQSTSRLKTPITAPVPANLEQQRQFEASKAKTMRLMLDKEQKYIRDLRNELLKVPDVRKSAELESAEQRCSTLQREIDVMTGTGQLVCQPTTPRNARAKNEKIATPTPNSGFLSGLPRSLSNLTGQSLRNLRQARQKQDNPPLVRQNSDESNNKRRLHSNTVPIVPTTCLDNSPPPLPPRSVERRNPNAMSPPINPLAKNKYYNKRLPDTPHPYNQSPLMSQSVPAYEYRRSSHSLDGDLDGPQPNSIALQMSYPLVNVPPPPLQMDNRNSVPVFHMRSRSSPEQLDHDLSKSFVSIPSPLSCHSSAGAEGRAGGEGRARDTPPPGTPPPPYQTNTQPCADPQRAIISMEEDDSPASDPCSYSGLFSNLRSVRESKARTAVLLNWLLGERRCACACLVLVLTDAYRSCAAPLATLRRWAYEIHSAFLMPHAVLQLSGVDENMANEIEHVLVNEYEKEELLRNVFRKPRQKAKEELAAQLTEFQVKRQVGLAAFYGPEDAVIDKCAVDKIQEQTVVERLMCEQLRQMSSEGRGAGGAGAHQTLLAALTAAALCLQCRPAAVASAAGTQRAAFLQRDKLYKQRVKHITKQHHQPFVVRGHHLQLQALTSVAHCHKCDDVIRGLAPQAYYCTDCKLRVHRTCARDVDEPCCIDADHHNNRISRFMERIHHNNLNSQDAADKKSRKASGNANFLNMERSFRKAEEDQPWEQSPAVAVAAIDRRDESDESLYESADGQSDIVSASDEATPRLGKTPTISKESLKLAVTDEESDIKFKKGHRKALSLSNTIEMVKHLGDDWVLDKNDKKKSKESLWSEEDRESINGSTTLLDQIRKNSRKEDKSLSDSRKSSTTDPPKIRKTSKGSSVSALNFLRRKKTPISVKAVEVVAEDPAKVLSIEEILDYTKMFLESEKRFASIENRQPIKEEETDSDDEPTPKQIEQQRRRLSRQASRSKSKARGKSQSLKVHTLRKSQSGTLKKGKKKGSKTPSLGRSRQASIVEQTPVVKKKHSQSMKQNSWLFSSYKGESKREGSSEEPSAPDADVDTSDAGAKEAEKDNSWRSAPQTARGVNRAESCRERDAPRRGKHRNASDPNRLTAHNNNDLEPGSTAAPSGSSSSSSLSSRSNESNTVVAEQQASQSELSDEEEALASQWTDSIPPHVLSTISLSARLRKRQEVIHELIVSEGSHVRWLKVLGRVFLRPLESQAGLLPPEELRALFPNLPSVRERHARLYSELRALRSDVTAPLVDVRAVADAMLNTLGEAGYASTLSKFCSGQRMALEALRERRRKNKDLAQFLNSREQLPLCGRLQLRDLLACVWQRLTKYQLLLESVLKTVEEEDSSEAARLRRALAVAKDVLHSVDTAIRQAENEHRLRSIQSKLEVRAPAAAGPEWEELRRLELSARLLRLEGDLAIRNDSNKKIHVLALMLEDFLVLLQREGDRFLLKPIPQPSQQQNLSPLIKWDKVLFRPNAAVRNTFFLMNINGVQMHELSANSASEYATWVKHIQEAPLAKLTDLKPNITPSHQATRSADDSGINVSRNPSDASEKSNSTVEDDCEKSRLSVERAAECERDRASAERAECERDRTSAERSSTECEREAINVERSSIERERDSIEERQSMEKEDDKEEKEEKHFIRRPTEGRISTHVEAPAPLEPRAALTVSAPAPLTAVTALSNQERLRRLDAGISRCLRAKALVVGDMLGVPARHYSQVADLAVAEALGQVDVSGELRARGDAPEVDYEPDVQQLLLAACTQANQLTTLIRGALSVSEGAGVAARARPGRCDSCRRLRAAPNVAVPPAAAAPEQTDIDADVKLAELRTASLEEFDTLSELSVLRDEDDDVLESSVGAAQLATRLLDATCGLQGTLASLLASQASAAAAAGRAERAALREANDKLRARLRLYEHQADEVAITKEDATIQDQPSNGG